MKTLYTLCPSWAACKNVLQKLALAVAVFGFANVSSAQRVTTNLVALYNFQEGTGSTVNDVSGVSPALNLTVQHPANVSWLSGGGLRVNSSTIIRTGGAATRMFNALNTSGEVSFEAWILPANETQTGPARLMTMSSSTTNRNFMVGQQGNSYVTRLRTTSTDNNGMPEVSQGRAAATLQHFVYTWKNGTERVYLNGQLKYTGTRNGALSNWNSSYGFALANEFTMDRTWLGDFYLVAVYCQELDQNEVNQNFNFGPGINYGNPGLVQRCTLTGYESTNGRQFWLPLYGVDFRAGSQGLTFDKFDNGTARLYGNVERIGDVNKKFNVDIWFSGESTYSQWVAQGGAAKEPQLGDETTWTFYNYDPRRLNKLIGTNSLNGVALYVYDMPDMPYGLQIGDGANALNANPNGFSAWFNYFGTQDDHGDVNSTINCQNICNNVTDGGHIGYDQSGCPGFDPAPIVNVVLPSGGSGAIETMWLFANASTGWNLTQIPGANNVLSYDPGPLTETTKFRRCTRRAGCSDWNGETNDVTITIEGVCCNASANVVIYNINNNSVFATLQNGGVYAQSSLPSNWNIEAVVTGTTHESVRFTFTGSLNSSNTQNAAPYRTPDDNSGLNLGVGNYTLLVQVFTQDNAGGIICDTKTISFTVTGCDNITNGGQIGADQTGCIGYDPNPFISVTLPTGGSGNIEYLWLFKNASTNNQFVEIPNSNSPTYDSGPLTQTTTFRRCSRRSGCSSWDGESNDVIVTITTNCACVNIEQICQIGDTDAGKSVWVESAFANILGLSNTNFVQVTPGTFTTFSDGSLKLEGTVRSAQDPNKRFNYVTWYRLRRNYAQWTAIPNANTPSGFREAKLDAGTTIPIGNEFLGWQYYELDPTKTNQWIGVNGLSGLNVTVTHMPADYRYGAQLGDRASLQSFGLGFSSWIFLNGTYNGQQIVNRHGDYNMRLTNCVPGTPFDATAQVVQPTCEYPCGGSITLSAVGGTGDYTFTWSDGFVGNTRVALCAGNYQVTVRSNNCTEVINVVLVAPTDCCAAPCGVDNTPPTASPFPPFVHQECDLPLQEITITDNCTTPSIEYNEYHVERVCELGYGAAVTNSNVWFHGMPAPYSKYHTWNDARFVLFPDGTAKFVGRAVNNALPNSGFIIEIFFEELVDWNTWSSQGGYNPGDALRTQRLYGEVDFTKPYRFDGYGAFEGSTIVLNPSGNPFGNVHFMDYGPRAEYGGFGAGFWISYSGTIGGLPVSGSSEGMQHLDSYNSLLNCYEDQGCEKLLVREWIATDVCGNASAFFQTVKQTDTEAPVASLDPQNLQLACNETVPTAPIITFEDNCDEEVIVDFSQQTTTNPNGVITITRIWTAKDDCNNTTVVDQIITITPCRASLGDRVWFDNNRNGIQDDGETGVPGVTVSLYTCAGVFLSSDITDADGLYLFPNLEPNQSYYVVFSNIPATYVFSPQDAGNDALDSDADNTGRTVCEFLSPNEDNRDYDAGINKPVASLGDRVWFDNNRNGLQDDGETGVPGVTVSLYTCAGVFLGTDITDADGFYLFPNLEPDQSYYVVFSNIPATFVFTLANVGANDAIDSDANQEGRTVCEFLSPGENNRDYDAGITPCPTPVIQGEEPQNLQIVCDAPLPTPANVVIVDPIFGNLNVTYSQQFIDNVCQDQYIRRWEATNPCGNSLVIDQVITLIDTIRPTLLNIPSNTTVQCGTAIADVVVTATDNCDTDLTVSLSANTDTLECGFLFTRTWSVTDDCGNTAVRSQVITIIDTIAPVAFNIPQNATYECDETVPFSEPSFTDGCYGNDVTVLYTETPEANDCAPDLIRRWTATDACGNTTVIVQRITIVDTTDPELESNIPAYLSFACDQPIPSFQPQFSDNCDETISVSLNEVVSDSTACGYTLTRTWTAVDDCGNDIQVVQVITVTDTEAPEVNGVPANITVECDNIPAPASVTATDNCSVPSLIFNETRTQGCPYTITRRWTATDACGLTTVKTQLITVIDTTSPTLVSTPELLITIECGDHAELIAPIFSDNCDTTLTIEFIELPTSGGCVNGLLRRWTAIDDCGNETLFEQIIQVIDTTRPNIESPVAPEIQVECDDIVPFNAPVFADVCDDNLDITFQADTVNINNCGFDIVRIWTATDNCGNDTTAQQIIKVRDTEIPVFQGVPANATVECSAIPAPALVTATDNCSLPTVTYTQTQTTGCPYTITRRWVAVDVCGNEAVAVQTLTVVDTTEPTVEVGVPSQVSVSCELPLPVFTPVFDDNCDENLTIIFTQDTLNVTNCGYDVRRRWVAVDDCNNDTAVEQYLLVRDTTDPVLSATPTNITVECTQIPAVPTITATDNCSVPTVIFNQTQTDGCPYVITRKWTATDACGNQTEHVQLITVVDTQDPILIGVPANINAQCGVAPAPAIVTASDLCDIYVPVTFSEVVVSASCPIQIIRTWTATDDCGNDVSATQTIYINDTTQPTLVGVPANATVECSAIPSPAQVTATDNCQPTLPVTFSQITEPIDACSYRILRTWTAIDACYNVRTATQTLTVIDSQAPVLSATPANATVACDNIPAPAQITASDLCDTYVPVTFNETTTEGCPYTITRTWTAADDCGNNVSHTQVLTVVDTVHPQLFGVPANTTIECGQVIQPVVVTASDNCTEVLSVQDSISFQQLSCGRIITRYWWAIDDCGNRTDASQTITVIDTTDPYIVETVPTPISVECDQPLPTYSPIFADVCDDSLTVTLDVDTINVNNCGFDVVRVWTATDDCGNDVSVYQTLLVRDTTRPVLVGVPANATVSCDNIPAPAVVTANDNCSEATVSFNQTQTTGCPYTITRMWTATDACGNDTTLVQLLTVIDTEAPTLNGVPANTTVSCTAIPAPAAVTASDNCTVNIVVSFNEQIQQVDNCNYNIVRTWSAQDNCLNPVMATQIISVIDTIAPVISGVDQTLTLPCNVLPGIVAPTVFDSCDPNVVLVPSFELIAGECVNERTEVYKWTATDRCGNTSERVLTFIFQDNEAPTLSSTPGNITVSCNAIPEAAIVTASDNCDTSVPVQFTQTIGSGCPYTITRKWTAVDDCNNLVEHIQLITVIDTVAPTLIGVPGNITLECGAPIPTATVTATDNCNAVLAVVPSQTVQELECETIITRTWTAIDPCGNPTSASQTITITDTTDPEIEEAPQAEIWIECNQPLPTAEVIFSDICDESLTLGFVQDTVLNTSCEVVVRRTWTATDNCGNATSFEQLVHLEDTTAPVLVGVPGNLNDVECSLIPAPAVVTAEDACNTITINFDENIVPFSTCRFQITRTWTAEDACGNISSASQVILTIDTSAPSVTNEPQDSIVECGQPVPFTAPSFSDVCDDELTITFTADTVAIPCGIRITRVWTAMDDCENTASVDQVITITDTTAPVFSNVPGDLTVECDDPYVLAEPAVSDACDANVTVVYTITEIPQLCGSTIVRRWVATDDCGLSTTVEQNIYIVDETLPELFNVPADTTIECGQPIPGPSPLVFATDNCDENVTIEVTEQEIPMNCGYQIKRAYTAKDDCLNAVVGYTIITIIDTTPPSMSAAPANVTVDCGSIPAPATLTATDVCDGTLTVIFTEESTGNCPRTITRTWRATDNCGNSTTRTQIITVVDNEDPVFVSLPFEININCEDFASYLPVAVDNCDDSVSVTIVDETLFSGGCFGVLLRTYRATDDCGNFTDGFQLIRVVDFEAPEVFNVPADTTIYCETAVPAVPTDIFATDNCTTDLEVTFSETQTSAFCPYDIIRTWTAVDFCENVTVATQVIHVEVEVAPSINLEVYPNPVGNGQFTVEFSVPSTEKVFGTIHDITGREVIRMMDGDADGGRLYKLRYDAQRLDPGTYVVRMLVDGEVHQRKFVVTGK